MFTSFPTYSRYRTLAFTSPVMKGEDVYALQTALNHIGCDCGTADGVLGLQTSTAIKQAQTMLGVVVDGLAGGNTQRALALKIADRIAQNYRVLLSVPKGQIEHESGFRLGNYSPIRADHSYDAGVCQRNTQHTSAEKGFHVPNSIDALIALVRVHYDLFEGVKSTDRRWQLAQGAWNAPAFACYLAREEGATKVTKSMTLKPSASQLETFNAYMRAVSLYYM